MLFFYVYSSILNLRDGGASRAELVDYEDFKYTSDKVEDGDLLKNNTQAF